MASSPPSHRACVRCQEVRPIEMFEMGPSGKRRRGVCTSCAASEGYRVDRRPRNGKPGGGTKRTFTDERGRRWRQCRRCERTLRLTSQSFHTQGTTYKDGTQVFAYLCKRCARAAVTERFRALRKDPVAVARRQAQQRAAQRRYRERHAERVREQQRAAMRRLRANPRRYAEYLETRRIERRLRRERRGQGLSSGRRPVAPKGPVVASRGPRVLPAQPLTVAISRAVIRRQEPVEIVCAAVGTDARSYTAWRSEREGVQVEVADRVITGLGLLWFDVYDADVWPEAYAQAEAAFG